MAILDSKCHRTAAKKTHVNTDTLLSRAPNRFSSAYHSFYFCDSSQNTLTCDESSMSSSCWADNELLSPSWSRCMCASQSTGDSRTSPDPSWLLHGPSRKVQCANVPFKESNKYMSRFAECKISSCAGPCEPQLK